MLYGWLRIKQKSKNRFAHTAQPKTSESVMMFFWKKYTPLFLTPYLIYLILELARPCWIGIVDISLVGGASWTLDLWEASLNRIISFKRIGVRRQCFYFSYKFLEIILNWLKMTQATVDVDDDLDLSLPFKQN